MGRRRQGTLLAPLQAEQHGRRPCSHVRAELAKHHAQTHAPVPAAAHAAACIALSTPCCQVVIITGSNTGLGKEAARALAARGAEVVIAVRDTARGEAAAADIRAKHPGAQLRVMACDLSSLASVQRFAAEYAASGKPCHVLIANAGARACAAAVCIAAMQALAAAQC